MARKSLQGDEEVELNLTPMIDVVFNLIIFFMIITDLSQKDIELLTLPKATQDKEDKGDEKDLRVIINVMKDVGKDSQYKTIDQWPPGGPVLIKVKGQKMNLKQLREYLWTIAEMKREQEEPDPKPSAVFALIRCDKDIRWREVQWVMQAAADPDVRIYKLQFATAKQEDN
jgi:biopolymer transport protein ExbD